MPQYEVLGLLHITYNNNKIFLFINYLNCVVLNNINNNNNNNNNNKLRVIRRYETEYIIHIQVACKL